MPNVCAVSTVTSASAPVPAAYMAVSDQPQISSPTLTLCLPADRTSPPPPKILPLPSTIKITDPGIAAAHAHEIDSIAQLINLSNGHVDNPEPVAPSVEPVADPTEGM